MAQDVLIEKLFETLITGDRRQARLVIAAAERELGSAAAMISELFWPTHLLLERLYRADQLSKFGHHMATRLLRVLVDQNASKLTTKHDRQRSILAFCGASENEELGAQMAVDMLEAAGFTVSFGGADVPSDEILAAVQQQQPAVLMMFCSAASDLPVIRELIDTLREINAAGGTQVAVGGGVFNRAEGLAEEIGADLWATSPMELVEELVLQPERRADTAQRTVGRSKRKSKAA